jgi:hypothetical protein
MHAIGLGYLFLAQNQIIKANMDLFMQKEIISYCC